MNTTQTINLGGIAFYIDDDAYSTLKAYLQSIEKNLGSDADKKEVMRDIEARIAEIFSDMRRREHIEVISINMVRAVMEQLGKPDDFREESPDEESAAESFKRFFRRKMYRDTDHKIIGGVCSGLGHWLGIDAVWLRIIFLLCLLLWGITLPVYLVLWIVMPEARTAAQRLDMRGEEPTIENIQREIEEQRANPPSNGGCLLTMLKICVWCIGGFFLFIALSVLFGVTAGLFGALAGLAAASPVGMLELLFSGNGWLITFFIVLITIVIGLPVFGIIYELVLYFRKGEHISRRVLLLSFIIWLLAVAGSIAIGVHELVNNDNVVQMFSNPQNPLRLLTDEEEDELGQTPLNVEPFSALVVNGASSIRLTQAEQLYVTSSKALSDDFTAEVEDGVLTITTGKNGAYVRIQTPSLKSISLSGAAKLKTQGVFVADTMTINSAGASDIDIKLDAQQLRVVTTGASEIELEGNADRLYIDVSGASKTDAEDFTVRVADVCATGASKVEVSVSDSLMAHSSGMSKITYTGEPYVSVSATGGGRVKHSK